MSTRRAGRGLLACGLVLIAASALAAGGATTRYDAIGFGAPPLAVALLCLGVAAFRAGSSPRRRGWALIGACGCVLGVVTGVVWLRPAMANVSPPILLPPGVARQEQEPGRRHVLLTLPADRRRAQLFQELQPVVVPGCRFERYGEAHDGGYVICGNLTGAVSSAYSYGISGYDQWGCDASRRLGAPVHEYDCFDTRRITCPGGRLVFHEECVGPSRRTDDNGRVFDSITNQVAANGDSGKHLIVKIDVEGAEWASFAATPEDVLQRIDQLVVEFHGAGAAQHLAVVQKLKRIFHVAHVHYNNNACRADLDPFPAWAYEVLFVNRSLVTAAGPAAASPLPLDAPNNPDPALGDCQGPTTRWAASVAARAISGS